MASNAALADSILENAEPLIARDLVSLTLGSEDPDDHRRFLELMIKRRQKDGPGAGATFSFTFDMSGAISAVPTPKPAEVIEADDLQPPDQPALPAPSDQDIDLSVLLGIEVPDPEPADPEE